MYPVRIIALAGFVAATACATAPNNETALFPQNNSYTEELADLSRIEMTERFAFERQSSNLDGVAVSVAWKPSGHETHFKNPKRPSKRIYNEEADENGTIFEIQNSMTPPGWRDESTAMFHIESGLRCPVVINLESLSRQYDLTQIVHFDETNRNVACAYLDNASGGQFNIFASHWPDITQEEHAIGAVSAIFDAHNVIEEMEVLVATIALSDEEEDAELFAGLELPHAIGFKVSDDAGTHAKTALWVVKTLDWHVKVRATFGLNDEISELIAALYFATSHLDVRGKNLENPVAPGVDV